MNILVTDGDNRSALAVTRSVAQKGCNVFVASSNRNSLASCSRFCRSGIRVPDPFKEGDAFIDTVVSIAAQYRIDLIFPMTEQTIFLLNCARDRLLPAHLACPPENAMLAVSDKVRLCLLAEKLGVPIPATLYVAGPADLAGQLKRLKRYPVVVKPGYSRRLEGSSFIPGSVKYASCQDELQRLYDFDPSLKYPSMIQEKVEGEGTGLFTLFDTNRHLALFSHRRLREKPPSGGVSVVSQSVPLDPEMVEASRLLLSAFEWNGVAMVEFKRDRRDGKAKLMEINGRFWGSLQLAIACGVDFPALLLDHLQGTLLPQRNDYTIGHKLKWFLGTLDHVLIRLRNCDGNLNLPAGAPSKIQSVKDFMNIFENNTSFDVFDWTDPYPFFAESHCYLRDAMSLLGHKSGLIKKKGTS